MSDDRKVHRIGEDPLKFRIQDDAQRIDAGRKPKQRPKPGKESFKEELIKKEEEILEKEEKKKRSSRPFTRSIRTEGASESRGGQYGSSKEKENRKKGCEKEKNGKKEKGGKKRGKEDSRNSRRHYIFFGGCFGFRAADISQG